MVLLLARLVVHFRLEPSPPWKCHGRRAKLTLTQLPPLLGPWYAQKARAARLWSDDPNLTEIRYIKRSQQRWGETEVSQADEQMSEVPTKPSSPGKGQKEYQVDRAGT